MTSLTKILAILFLTTYCELQTFNSYSQAEVRIIIQDSLPVSVRGVINKKYANYSVNRLLKIIDKGVVSYKIKLTKKTKILMLEYNKDGLLISKEKSKVYSFEETKKQFAPPVNSGQNHSGGNHGGHQH